MTSILVSRLLAAVDPPWKKDFVDSFNGLLRDEPLNREWFSTLAETKVLIEAWPLFYNERQPHSALGYRPTAAFRTWPLRSTSQICRLESRRQGRPGQADADHPGRDSQPAKPPYAVDGCSPFRPRTRP